VETPKLPLSDVLVYKKQIDLSETFHTSGSSVRTKTTYLYYQPAKSKLVEIPYSPSMGESAERMLSDCELVKRNLTWFDFDVSHLSSPKRFDRLAIHTYGIGQELKWQPGQMLKLKADRHSITSLVEWSHRFASDGISWFVDFNQGLSASELTTFLNSVNLTTCFGIEQPLPIGQVHSSLCKAAPLILDEEMSDIDPAKLLRLRPKAVVLKPWRYTWLQYKKWHDFLLAEEIPYLVGTMIQDAAADHLCDQLNQRAPIQYEQKDPPLDIEAILAKATLVGQLKLLSRI